MTCMFVAVLLTVLALPQMVAASGDTWVFGQPGGRLTADSQGVDGFYYMFTRQFNTGGVYDVGRFDYLVWSNNTTWRFFGGNAWTPPYTGAQIDDRFFNPNATNEHGQPEAIDDYWFAIFGDGRVLPGANFTPVIRWVAPAAGTFTVDVVLHAGVNRQFFGYYTAADAAANERVDGVTTTIMHGRDRLFTANSGIGQIDQNRISVPVLTVNMQAGEHLYFITDQNADSAWDYSTWHITIAEVAAAAPLVEDPTPAEPTLVVEEPTPVVEDEPTEDEPTEVVEAEPTEEDATTDATEAEPTEDIATDPTEVIDEPTDGTAEDATEEMPSIADEPTEASATDVSAEPTDPTVYTPAAQETVLQESDNNGLSAAAIAIIIVGAVAVCAAAAWFIIRNLKK